MRSILALATRILQQFAHDKRTIVMFLLGPVLVLWLFSVLLDSATYHPTLAYVDLPEELSVALADEDAICIEFDDYNAALELLQNREVDAVLTLDNGVLTVLVEGADASKTGSVVTTVSSAVKVAATTQREQVQADITAQIDSLRGDMEGFKDDLSGLFSQLENLQQSMASSPQPLNLQLPDLDALPLDQLDFDQIELDVQPLVEDVEVAYLHGDENWGTFDYFGPVIIGIFVFIFVFITSGMSLVTERTGGTMERLLVTPIKPYQLVSGFCLGFGVVTIIQATVVLWACVSLIGFPNEGPLALVVLVAISMALVSLTLGLVVSAVAKTPFQVIQLMLILVIPQVLLSGIFDLSNTPMWMQVLNKCFPISYGAEALRDIMLRGAGLADIGFNIAVLWAFIAVFFLIATASFHRRKTQ